MIRVAGAASSTPRRLRLREDRGILPQPPQVLARQSKVDADPVSRADNSGSPPRLAGNNFAVGPALISHLDPQVIEESDIPPLVARRGGTVAWAEGAVVLHTRRYRLIEALGDRLRLGWTFGRRRAARFKRTGRLAGLLAGPAIWLVQVARLGVTVLPSGRHRARFAASLPFLLGMVTAWTAGEWLGWASGFRGPGPSAQRTLRD